MTGGPPAPGPSGRPVVLAVGGNAVAVPGQPVDRAHLRAAVHRAGPALAAAVDGRPAVVTHGNGPQVGELVALAERAGDPAPLDELDALTQGELGYLLVEELTARLPDRDVVGVLTRVEVDPDDPALRHPTKPIGPRDGTRRLVPSPEPVRLPELRAVATLVDAGHVVVAVGGGGIPVAVGGGDRRGVDAVVDKDLASSLLAIGLDAESLVLLTDVPAVVAGWGTTGERALTRVPASQLDPAGFEAGSMAPKVEAARRFVAATGRRAAIGALDDAVAVLAGRAGTQVLPG